MPCEDCKYSITYLHRVGGISDSLFQLILAGNKNKKYYDAIHNMRPSKEFYESINLIPSFLKPSFQKR